MAERQSQQSSEAPRPIVVEHTPNPATLRFWLGRDVWTGEPFELSDRAQARRCSPLALCVLECVGIERVLVARDFVAATRHDGVSWREAGAEVARALERFLGSGEDAVIPSELEAPAALADPTGLAPRIQALIAEQIRPRVAADGGEIALIGVSAGIVELELRGACADCPGALDTLRQQVERRLRSAFPEIRAVTARAAGRPLQRATWR